MAAKCPQCSTSGDNMKKCSACGQVFCKQCVQKGIGKYSTVKQSDRFTGNKCPLCGALNKISTFKG